MKRYIVNLYDGFRLGLQDLEKVVTQAAEKEGFSSIVYDPENIISYNLRPDGKAEKEIETQHTIQFQRKQDIRCPHQEMNVTVSSISYPRQIKIETMYIEKEEFIDRYVSNVQKLLNQTRAYDPMSDHRF